MGPTPPEARHAFFFFFVSSESFFKNFPVFPERLAFCRMPLPMISYRKHGSYTLWNPLKMKKKKPNRDRNIAFTRGRTIFPVRQNGAARHNGAVLNKPPNACNAARSAINPTGSAQRDGRDRTRKLIVRRYGPRSSRAVNLESLAVPHAFCHPLAVDPAPKFPTPADRHKRPCGTRIF